MARRTGRPSTLIADDPRTGFRAVSGLVLALFITTVAVALITTENAHRSTPVDGPAASVLADQFSYTSQLGPSHRHRPRCSRGCGGSTAARAWSWPTPTR